MQVVQALIYNLKGKAVIRSIACIAVLIVGCSKPAEVVKIPAGGSAVIVPAATMPVAVPILPDDDEASSMLLEAGQRSRQIKPEMRTLVEEPNSTPFSRHLAAHGPKRNRDGVNPRASRILRPLPSVRNILGVEPAASRDMLRGGFTPVQSNAEPSRLIPSMRPI